MSCINGRIVHWGDVDHYGKCVCCGKYPSKHSEELDKKSRWWKFWG